MTVIRFFEEKDGFNLKEKLKIKSWLKKIAENEKRIIRELNYIFLDDERLLEINQEYLDHHDYTDIITFDLGEQEGEEVIEGEIYISVERVKENAKTLGEAENKELKRVIAHGLLHLCGYRDKSAVDLQVMRTKENESLALWNDMFHVEQ